MARSNLSDYLQVYPFWLMDVAPIEPLALPIFSPLLGFSSITAPEIQIETFPVTEGNWFFDKQVVKKGSASNITLTRASQWYDSDFYRWVLVALTGETGGTDLLKFAPATGHVGGVSPRRDLLLIHFKSRSPLSSPALTAAASASGVLGLVGTSVRSGVGGASQAAATAGAAIASGSVGYGPFEFAPRIPAKAWLLKGCIPTRYKAGTDFDASSGAISIAELDLAIDYFDEISLTS
jgi:hypothetical protein